MVELTSPQADVERREAEMRRAERLSNPYATATATLPRRKENLYAKYDAQSPLEQLRASQYEAGRKEGYILGRREGRRTGWVEGFLVGAVTIFWIAIVWSSLTI